MYMSLPGMIVPLGGAHVSSWVQNSGSQAVWHCWRHCQVWHLKVWVCILIFYYWNGWDFWSLNILNWLRYDDAFFFWFFHLIYEHIGGVEQWGVYRNPWNPEIWDQRWKPLVQHNAYWPITYVKGLSHLVSSFLLNGHHWRHSTQNCTVWICLEHNLSLDLVNNANTYSDIFLGNVYGAALFLEFFFVILLVLIHQMYEIVKLYYLYLQTVKLSYLYY